MYLQLIVLFTLYASCSQSQRNNETLSDTVSLQSASPLHSVERDSFNTQPISSSITSVNNFDDDLIQDYFIIIADTSESYYILRNTMFDISKKSGLLIDSLGRIFDSNRGIIVPHDSEDEIYAGEYFPRRFEGSELSIEYCNAYDNKSHKTQMALVAGQYTELNAAQKQLRKIKQLCPKAFIIPAKLYNGCMH